MKHEINNQSWLFIFPISHLYLSTTLNKKIVADRVTFIAHSQFQLECGSGQLSHVPTYDELKQDKSVARFLNRIEPENTLALCRQSGQIDTAYAAATASVSDSLDVIALSMLYRGDVRPLHGRQIATGDHQRIAYLAISIGRGERSISNSWTPIRHVNLDEAWFEWQDGSYFEASLEFLNRNNGFTKPWHMTIMRAIKLVAEGLSSRSNSFAFLHNMIALEAILIQNNEKHGKILPYRLNAFLGWSPEWIAGNYRERINSIYDKRNNYVHNGDLSSIERSDVAFTDHLLYNVFNNIFRHAHLFPSQNALIIFSDRIAAEQTLGITPKDSKYLPMTMSMVLTLDHPRGFGLGSTAEEE